MLSMNLALQRSRQILFVLIFLVSVVWLWAEMAQHILRQRAEHLLVDLRAIHAGQSTWEGIQPFLRTWSQWTTAKSACTPDACTIQIDLVQALPAPLVGSPAPGAHNWLPRLAGYAGLRNSAVRAGLTVERGIVTTRWFGEQVTLPVRDWNPADNFIPYLSVSSSETTHFHQIAGDERLPHPNRMVQHKASYLALTNAPEEDPGEKAALMDFHLACITRLRPCESPAQILPEAQRLFDEQKLAGLTG